MRIMRWIVFFTLLLFFLHLLPAQLRLSAPALTERDLHDADTPQFKLCGRWCRARLQREVRTRRTRFTTGVRWLPSSRTSTSLLLACHCSSCSRRIWCTGRCASCKTTLRNPRACPGQIWRTALELGAHLDGSARYRAGLHGWARRLQSESLLIDNARCSLVAAIDENVGDYKMYAQIRDLAVPAQFVGYETTFDLESHWLHVVAVFQSELSCDGRNLSLRF